MFLLESPHRGDSNKDTQYTIFHIKKENQSKLPKCAAMIFFQGLKNKFEKAVVNEPSMFRATEFYCIMVHITP